MAWRRKRGAGATVEGETVGESVGATDGGDDVVLHPDDAVLDELSQAFGDDDHVDAGDASNPGDAVDVDVDAVDAVDAGDSPVDRPTISIGGDDDLPDAVYLDDEVDGSGGDAPVFIDDDGSTDAVLPKDATARGIEPRLRQRRIGVRRAASRRRLWWAALAVVVVLVVVGVLAVLGSSWFAVDRVSVSGAVYTDAAMLEEIVEDLRGTPVLLVDTDDVEERIEAIPWVDAARVTTRFPDSARIEIRERTPIAAILGSDGRSRVLDVDGRVLSVIDGQPVALVWIAGPDILDLGPGEFAPVGYSAAASLVTKLTPAIRERTDSILVTPDGSDLVLVLTGPSGPIEVRFGSAIGDTAQIEKLVRLERELGDIGDEPVSVIDVSTSEVIVR